jgi:hypothetical protein
MNKNYSLNDGIYFIEQTVLSITIAQLNLKVHLLDKRYNYHVSAYLKKWAGLYPFNLKKTILLHYHKAFESQKFSTRLLKKIGKVSDDVFVSKIKELQRITS